ncbi:MAG: YkgJ family cysteine cluster protein [Planctomycetota bacterium]|jgi:Fe-S-cluster containining protein
MVSGEEERDAVAAAWRAAARRPEIDAAIRAIHESIEREVATRRPLCLASGNCCRFEAFDHRLMVTGLETAWTLGQAETPVVDAAAIAAARDRGDCPFLAGGERRLCGIRTARPMPCRAFFCDRAATGWQQELHERSLAELRALHDRFEVPYRYLEWRECLAWLVPDRGLS